MSDTNPDNENSGMTEYDHERITLEEVKAARKIKLIAYLLWFFLGWLMVHRMYLGHVKAAVLWCLMFVAGAVMVAIALVNGPGTDAAPFLVLGTLPILACLVNWIVDSFRIPKMAHNKIQIIRNTIQAEGERRIREEKEEGLRQEIQAEKEQRNWYGPLVMYGLIVGVTGLIVYLVTMEPQNQSPLSIQAKSPCDRLKPQILTMLEERAERKPESPRFKVLKIYKDVEDLTEAKTKEQVKTLKSYLSIDNDTKLLRLCKGRVFFASQGSMAVYFYETEDVDGDRFIGYSLRQF